MCRPVDVSYDNSENPLVQVFNSYLSENPAVKVAVDAVTAAYKADSATPVYNDAANVAAKSAILGALGGGGGLLAGGLAGLKLKKTTTNHKSMFGDMEGKVREGAAPSMVEKGDGRKKLSQLIDFPGNLEEITGHLNSPDRIDPAGKDFYGLTALQVRVPRTQANAQLSPCSHRPPPLFTLSPPPLLTHVCGAEVRVVEQD